MIGKIFAAAIDAARRGIRFRCGIERAQRHRYCFIFAAIFAAAFFPSDFRNAEFRAPPANPNRSRRNRSLRIARPSRRKNKDAPRVGPES